MPAVTFITMSPELQQELERLKSEREQLASQAKRLRESYITDLNKIQATVDKIDQRVSEIVKQVSS